MTFVALGEDGWPLRASVEAAWRSVAAGQRTRESVHNWSVPWVEGHLEVDRPRDLMVGTGLQYLHGLDMTTDPASPGLICMEAAADTSCPMTRCRLALRTGSACAGNMTTILRDSRSRLGKGLAAR